MDDPLGEVQIDLRVVMFLFVFVCVRVRPHEKEAEINELSRTILMTITGMYAKQRHRNEGSRNR